MITKEQMQSSLLTWGDLFHKVAEINNEATSKIAELTTANGGTIVLHDQQENLAQADFVTKFYTKYGWVVTELSIKDGQIMLRLGDEDPCPKDPHEVLFDTNIEDKVDFLRYLLYFLISKESLEFNVS